MWSVPKRLMKWKLGKSLNFCFDNRMTHKMFFITLLSGVAVGCTVGAIAGDELRAAARKLRDAVKNDVVPQVQKAQGFVQEQTQENQ